jgi:AcrR family transcriptional regulator
VFGTRGFHEGGVRELCAEAKLTERYFYESFENRESLFLAVYDDAVLRVRTAIARAIAESESGAQGLARAGLSAFLKMLRDDPRLARVLLIDVLAIGEGAGARSLVATQSFAELVATVTSGIHPNLEREKRDAKLIANGLVGSTLFIAVQWARGGFREPLSRVLDHAALFYEAVAASVGGSQRKRRS